MQPSRPLSPPLAKQTASLGYPGQVFQQGDQDYAAQMAAYAIQRQARRQHARKPPQPPLTPERSAWHSRVEDLRAQRRRHRLAAQASDAAWRRLRQAHREGKAAWRALSVADKGRQREQHTAADACWRQDHQARRAEVAACEQADHIWRRARQALCSEQAQWTPMLYPVPAWLAILVIIDNCTRRCLGLPCFMAGVHVTGDAVAEALRPLLPAGVQFVISDNGAQFRSDAFVALSTMATFEHVRIAPYRACTNGIAERFVRTVKECLEGYGWSAPDAMPDVLTNLMASYNDCPHQGRDLGGLSPNEYDRRLRIHATC
jgi:transposase InsO family protein